MLDRRISNDVWNRHQLRPTGCTQPLLRFNPLGSGSVQGFVQLKQASVGDRSATFEPGGLLVFTMPALRA